MTGGTANGQGATKGTGPKPPDASELVEHLKAATEEIAAAGKAFVGMVEQAMGELFTAMTGWAGSQGREEKPRVEKIDVEDERKPKED